MSTTIASLHQTDSNIIACHKNLEGLLVKRQKDIASMTLVDAIFLINESRDKDAHMFVRPIKNADSKKTDHALLYTEGSFSIGFLLDMNPEENLIQENYLKSEAVGMRFASSKIKSPVFSFCCITKNIEEEVEKACRELKLKIIVTWESNYDRKYLSLRFDRGNTEMLNPVWESQGSFLKFESLCSKLDHLLSYNMPRREVEKNFTGTSLYCKLIERESTREVARTAKIFHYGIATCKTTEESVELIPKEPEPQSREHLSPWECWEREVEQREWDREIGHDFH